MRSALIVPRTAVERSEGEVRMKIARAKVRKSAILGGVVLAAGLLGPSGAWAECIDTTTGGFGSFIYPAVNQLWL